MLIKCFDFRIIEEHPALARAASHVIAAVTEDTKARSGNNIANLESAEMEDLERVDPGVQWFIFLMSLSST